MPSDSFSSWVGFAMLGETLTRLISGKFVARETTVPDVVLDARHEELWLRRRKLDRHRGGQFVVLALQFALTRDPVVVSAGHGAVQPLGRLIGRRHGGKLWFNGFRNHVGIDVQRGVLALVPQPKRLARKRLAHQLNGPCAAWRGGYPVVIRNVGIRRVIGVIE